MRAPLRLYLGIVGRRLMALSALTALIAVVGVVR